MRLLAVAVGVIATKFALGFVSFPPPTFKSEWITLSTEGGSAFLQRIPHGLNEAPIFVKVFVKVTDGPNKDYVFEAGGAIVNGDLIDTPRGGVLFAYSSSKVLVWISAQTPDNKHSNPILIGGTWGSGNYAQTTDNALIQVLAWSAIDFYEPDFISDGFTMGTGDDIEVEYNFTETPAIVSVIGKYGEWHFLGSGSQLARHDKRYRLAGGLLYAYSSRSTRVWSPADTIFCGTRLCELTVDVRVYAWRPRKCLSPHFDSDWFDVDQTAQTFYELTYGECGTTRHVDVDLLAVDGANQGFIFKGSGKAQSLEKMWPSDAAGGVVFAHSTNAVRLWMTYSPSDSGRGLVTVQGWGSHHQQLSSTGKLRVRVWCENNAGTPRWVPSGSYLTATLGAAPHPPLVTMVSENTSSLVGCVVVCKRTTCCAYLSRIDGNCTIYGELEFGKTAAQPDSRDLYHLNTTPCDP